ncbi:sulfite exporter TauE/SafE family protein, partial [Candidatus Bipolaricaulota bacterium]|nr:sulfite exporter TauE/SafE family protein [Candidatus Bipolaricaulota bacterium]
MIEWGTFFMLFALAVAIGFVASLLGLGGGVFMTPLLLLGGFVATQPEAAGTSVAAVVFTGLSASIAYFGRKVIDYRIGLLFMPTAIIGVFLGKAIIATVNPSWLTIAFGIFLLYPMSMMLLGKTPKDTSLR